MPIRPAQPHQGSANADPFDLWLRRSLHQSWDATLEEQVPEDLLRLFSDDRREREATKARWLELRQPARNK
ncbi:MAG TPA: hypothetical protein VIL69_16980 [Roseomonas sp.]|jgi:hypothetical protein